MCVCSVTECCLSLCHPMDYSPPGSSVHGVFRQEYWSRLPFPPPEDHPNPGAESMSPTSPALAGRFLTTQPPGKPPYKYTHIKTLHAVYLIFFLSSPIYSPYQLQWAVSTILFLCHPSILYFKKMLRSL